MKSSGNGHYPGSAASRSVRRAGITEDESGFSLNSGSSTCLFDPHRGGRLQKWNWHTVPPPDALDPRRRAEAPQALNLVYPEAGALLDHFLPLGTKPEDMASGTYREYGDFVEEAFAAQAVEAGGELRLAMQRDGEIRAGKRSAEVRLMKSAALRPEGADLQVLYRIINSSLRPLQILFAVELNLFAPGIYDQNNVGDGFYQIDGARPADSSLDSTGISPDATHVALANESGEMALQLGWDRECDVWRMPSTAGGQQTAGVRLFAIWRIQLPPRDNWSMGLWLAPS